MTRGSSPWGDPAVETGFRAAYEPYTPAQERRTLPPVEPAEPLPTVEDERAEAADVAARPLLADGRRARAVQPGRLSPGRAAAGAAVSVAGVALGIATLLWISDAPAEGPGPVVAAGPAPADDVVLDPFASRPEGETAPVDPPPPPPPPPPPAVLPPVPSTEPAAAPSVVVPVLVLNNSRIAGLADRGAARFERAGWPVADTGNYRGRIRTTTVYYPAGLEPAAREFARRFAGIERVLPRPDNLPGSGLTVVLTRDFVS